MSLLRDDETGLVLIKPDWPTCPNHVKAFSSTRMGGVSLAPYGDSCGDAGLNLGDHVGDDIRAVHMNRACLTDFMPSPVTFLSQIHGNMVVDIAAVNGNAEIQADACFSTVPKVVCAVLTADCLPILLSSESGDCVAAVHAGWRGLADGVVEAAVQRMVDSGAKNISAWMGPAIGPQAFEVGADVFDIFSKRNLELAQFFSPAANDGKFFADIYAIARTVLRDVGVFAVYGGEYCTYTDADLFYSYRRDGVTGRMASWIWIE